MKYLPQSIQDLIDEFNKLPGVGPKTASRLAFYMLSKSNDDRESLSQALHNLKKDLKVCDICYNYSDKNPCDICVDPKRDKNKIMVVEEPLDVLAILKTQYNGVFHVLGGVISPIDGIGPEQLRIGQLLDKIKGKENQNKEVILATDPSLEGEATAMYIAKQIEKLENKIEVTRIARGLPVGSDLEYADEITLNRALEGRSKY